jgi:hypothetical protein
LAKKDKERYNREMEAYNAEQAEAEKDDAADDTKQARNEK